MSKAPHASKQRIKRIIVAELVKLNSSTKSREELNLERMNNLVKELRKNERA